MLITRVEIRNIKNHAEATFDFNPGVTAICGPNGAGKTTIIEAIAWALFDYLEYNRDDFVRRGSKKGQVDISFHSNLDDREYLVHRDSGGGYYVYDLDTKVKLVEQKSQVISWLKEHIGVEPTTDLPTLYKTTIGVPQGTFTTDFAQPPTPRKKIFDQILGVEEYRQASDNLKETQRFLTTRLTETDRKIAEAEGELKVYDELKKQFDELTAGLKKLEQQLIETTAQRDETEKQARQLTSLGEQIASQHGVVERTNIKLQLTRGNLATATEAAEQAQQAATIIQQSRAGYERYLQTTQQLTALEKQRESREALRAKFSQTEREMVTAKVQSERAQERLTEVQQAREELSTLAERLEEQKQLEKRLYELRESRGQAQGWQHAQDALDRELEKLRARFGELTQQLKDAEQHRAEAEQVEALEGRFSALSEQLSQQVLARQSAQHKQQQLAQARGELERLQAEQARLKSEIARLQPLAKQVAQLLEAENRQQQNTQQLAGLRAEVARDSEMITALESGGICPLLTEKCLNLKPGESLDRRFKSGLEARRKEIARLEKDLPALANELKKLHTAEAEIKRLPKLEQEATTLATALQKQQSQVAQLEKENIATVPLSDTQAQQLQQERQQIELQLRQAREAHNKLSQASVLVQERERVKAEGESKRAEREALQQKLSALDHVTTQLAETETRLQSLGDPRSRATALNQTIKRADEWQQVATSAQTQAQQINVQLDQLNLELQAFAELDRQLAEARAARAANEADYQAFIGNEKIAANVTARQAEAKSLADELAQTESALNAATAQLVAWEEQYNGEEHRRLLLELNQLRERTTQLNTQLEHTREQHNRLQAQLAHLGQVRDQMRADIATHEKVSGWRDTTEFIRDTLQKAAPYITDAYLHSISIEANQLYREITGSFDATLKWSNDYEITLEERGYARPFANLSGGEQMAAALAVRLALLHEFSDNLSLAFFDEPTTNMDEDRRRNLAQQIGRITGFKQLFVISHDDSFENFTDQVITLGARE